MKASNLNLKKLIYFLLLQFISGPVLAQGRPVDLLFCMDLSGSTNGLMDDLRDRIWDMTEQFQSVSPSVQLRIGMVGYSRPSFGKSSGYSKVISPLTDDFDQLSFDLFTLKPYIEKGDQLVGAALQLAVKGINWSREEAAVKIIFLVGNGSVAMGSVDFREVCEEAARRNIQILPVYCSKADKSRELSGWREIARMSGTEVREILIHSKPVISPVCTNINALKEADIRLVNSYMPYGEKGFSRLKLMKDADNRSFNGGPLSFESRVHFKRRLMGSQAEWDLVDYLREKGSLPEFDHNTLPDTLKMIPDENLVRVVLQLKEERERAMGEINRLLPENRNEQLQLQRAVKQSDQDASLETVVVEAYLVKLKSLGFAVRE